MVRSIEMEMREELVLSIFPGLDILGRAFESEGFYVVRGQDAIWGGDVRNEHPPAGKFDGVIGGPPCQEFSVFANLVRHNGNEPRFGNLIPEYERIVREAQPRWAVMEEVPGAPLPEVEGYERWAHLITDSDVGGVQPRERRFTLLLKPELWPHVQSPWTLLEYDPQNGEHTTLADSRPVPVAIGGSGKRKASIKADPRPTRREARAVHVGHGAAPGQRDAGAPMNRPQIADMCEAQGLPRDFFDRIEEEVRHRPFTKDGQRHLLGNGVPMSMGRAVARVVKRIGMEEL